MDEIIKPLDRTRDAWFQAMRENRLKEHRARKEVKYFYDKVAVCYSALEDLGVPADEIAEFLSSVDRKY